MGFYDEVSLREMGFLSVGKGVLISTKASIYGASRISIGNKVRIDDFCVISAGEGGIEVGSYVHIAVYCSLIGSARITLSDFSGLSSRVSIYSSSDDYSGKYLTNPTIPDKYRGVHNADVVLGKHVIIGAGAIVLPGSHLEEGVAIGALSLVSKRCEAYGIYSGVPARRISERSRRLLQREQELQQEMMDLETRE